MYPRRATAIPEAGISQTHSPWSAGDGRSERLGPIRCGLAARRILHLTVAHSGATEALFAAYRKTELP